MGRLAARAAFASAAAAGLLACAHAPPARDSGPAPLWPRPPASPRARWSVAFPAPESGQPSFWSRALDAVVGREDSAASRPLFPRPFAVAADGAGILVADPDDPGVFRVDVETGRITAVDCPNRSWQAPMALAAGPGSVLFVADAAAGLIVAVPTAGTCREIGRGSLQRPTGIALAAGRVYVVDPPRHEVVAFSPEGTEVLRFGSRGEGAGELNYPTAIAAQVDGTLLVVDALNFRITRFTADGKHLGSFGEPGEVGGLFARPKGIAVDGQGRIFVTDAQRDRVLVFDPAGGFSFAIGESGSGPGELALPAGVAVEGDHLYVADSYNHRIQVYRLLGDRT